MNRKDKELRAAELGRLARFGRAVDRLASSVDEAFYHVSFIANYTTMTEGPPNIRLLLPERGLRIAEAPAEIDIENVMARLRPIFSTSNKEECSFEKIGAILPKFFVLELPIIPKMISRWMKILSARTVILLPGARVFLRGHEGVTQSEGLLEVGVEGRILTGQEALELTLYGEIQHLDADKERMRRFIRADQALENGYRVALSCIAAQLLSVAKDLNSYVRTALDGLSDQDRKLADI